VRDIHRCMKLSAGAGEHGTREPAASCRSSLGGPPPAGCRPGRRGLAVTHGPRAACIQKAPGVSRGTPGREQPSVPCDAGLSRGSMSRRLAWTAGWFAVPESPGFRPGLLGQARRRREATCCEAGLLAKWPGMAFRAGAGISPGSTRRNARMPCWRPPCDGRCHAWSPPRPRACRRR